MELTQEQIDIITDILEEAFQNAAVYTSFPDDTLIRMDSLVGFFYKRNDLPAAKYID